MLQDFYNSFLLGVTAACTLPIIHVSVLDPPSPGQVLSSWMFSMCHLQWVPGRGAIHCRYGEQDLLHQRLPQVRSSITQWLLMRLSFFFHSSIPGYQCPIYGQQCIWTKFKSPTCTFVPVNDGAGFHSLSTFINELLKVFITILWRYCYNFKWFLCIYQSAIKLLYDER